MLRIEPLKEDQAESAILELVDGPTDMRFALTAKTIARRRTDGVDLNEITARNILKVTKYRPRGVADLENMVQSFTELAEGGDAGVDKVEKRKVYPDGKQPRSKDHNAEKTY